MSCSLDDIQKKTKKIMGATDPVTLSYVQQVANLLHIYGEESLNEAQRQGVNISIGAMAQSEPKIWDVMEALAKDDPDIAKGLDRYRTDQKALDAWIASEIEAKGGPVEAMGDDLEEEAPAEKPQASEEQAPSGLIPTTDDGGFDWNSLASQIEAWAEEDKKNPPSPAEQDTVKKESKKGKGGGKPAGKKGKGEASFVIQMSIQGGGDEALNETLQESIGQGINEMTDIIQEAYPPFMLDTFWTEGAVGIAKSLSNHLDPQKGDGVIRDDYVLSLNSLEEAVSALAAEKPENMSEEQWQGMVSHWQAVAKNLRESMDTAVLGQSGWKKPARVMSYASKTLRGKKLELKLPPLPPQAETDPVFGQGYRYGVGMTIARFKSLIFPANPIDEQMASAAVTAAKSLARHAHDGQLTPTAQNGIAALQKMLATLQKPATKERKLFDSDVQLNQFISHYQAILQDLMECAKVLELGLGKKPNHATSFFDSNIMGG